MKGIRLWGICNSWIGNVLVLRLIANWIFGNVNAWRFSCGKMVPSVTPILYRYIFDWCTYLVQNSIYLYCIYSSEKKNHFCNILSWLRSDLCVHFLPGLGNSMNFIHMKAMWRPHQYMCLYSVYTYTHENITQYSSSPGWSEHVPLQKSGFSNMFVSISLALELWFKI